MSPIEYADKLRLQVAELRRVNKPLLLAASSVTAEMHERIFSRGEASGSGSIGQYNDKRILYLNPNSPYVYGGGNFTNSLLTKFKNGKTRKTVKTTYKGYKSLLGKPAGGAYKSLELTGDLQSNFVNRVIPNERGGAIVSPESKVVQLVGINEYVIGLEKVNLNKAMGAESYSKRKIFSLSFGELYLFRTIAEYELKKMFS